MDKSITNIRLLLHVAIVLVLLVASVQAAQTSGQTNGITVMEEKQQEIAAIHAKHDAEIMAIEGVVSVGVGLTRDGEPCLKIGASGSTEGIREKLPEAIRDICVEIDHIGKIEAQ